MSRRRRWFWVVVCALAFAPGVPVPTWAGSPARAELQAPVNLNTAGVEELVRLPGVGEKTARAILDYRDQNGPFRSVDDLLAVKGIGEKKLQKLRELVVVE